ncbi:MAG: MotA/TolQ/ExbB proton channel family protein [Gemmatimonadales bacterium]|nr:MAG: MotA/TolQ/ExbB proton channel family protein [Gemmatimonadales bacterium]
MEKESGLDNGSGAFEYNLLTLFADGGPMMYALLLCSLVALGVTIAKAWTLWVAHRDTDRIIEEVRELAEAGRIEEAIRICADTPGPASAILLSGLRRIQKGQIRAVDLEQAINTTGTIELGFLERGLVVLATVANVAPLMGFLGTVAGMIMAFQAIEIAGDVEPSLVAAGIKVALLTTATGLLIAIPVNVAYNFFVTRIDKLIVDMEQGTQEILNLAWTMETRGDLVMSGEPTGAGRGTPKTAGAMGATASPPAPGPEGSDVKPDESGA